MTSTKSRIIKTAIDQFNQYGVANVRVHGIAEKMNISPGNLTYHYKTKSQLMYAIHEYMVNALGELMGGKENFNDAEDVILVIRDYLQFQIQYRFFYRDVLEILQLCPDLKSSYQSLIQAVIHFNKSVVLFSIERGFAIAEPYKGHYDILVKNNWAVLYAWLTEREVLGDKAISIADGIKAVFHLYFPYLTEKGKVFYFKMIQELPKWVKDEMQS